MKLRLIGAEKAQHPVSLLCELLGVSRSGFHAWLRRQPSKRWLSDVRLLELIHAIHEESAGIYGSPRIHARAAPPRHPRGPQAGRAADAPPFALRGGQAAHGEDQRSGCPACVRRPTWCGATSSRASRTGSGWQISLRSRPGRASSLLGRRARLLRPPGGRLGDGGAHARKARRRGGRDRGQPPQARAGAGAPLPPGRAGRDSTGPCNSVSVR
jgi:hypothetical protein